MPGLAAATTASVTIAVAASIVGVGASSAAAWPAPPPGTTFWVNPGGDLIVVKKAGKRVRISNPLAPCYTGIRQADGSYRGGGYNQGGGYWRQRVRFVFQEGQQALKLKQSKVGTTPQWYTAFTRDAALRRANPRPDSVVSLFSDCELRK